MILCNKCETLLEYNIKNGNVIICPYCNFRKCLNCNENHDNFTTCKEHKEE